MNKKLQTCALALAACACCAAEECQPLTYANPIDLLYRVRPEEKMCFREGADPEIVLHADKYWLFASKCGGYYVSDDLANWRHVATDDLPLEEYAPTVVEIDGTLYFSSRGATVWRAVDPLAGKWKKVPGCIPSVDSALFLDDDGRLYDYEGGSSDTRQPIRVYEIDRKTMRPVAGEKPVACFTADRSRYGYEARGHNNELVASGERLGCLEGSHMIKRDGRYYFQFAGPGTEFFSYSDTAFVGETPKGPFARQALNPFSFKNFGYAKGAGHGKTFRDRHGNFWHVTTCTYFGVDRRIMLFPVFFDRDGEMWCDTAFSDWPLAIPNRRCESPEDYHTGWMPLSDGKAATASSNGGAAKNASDGDARTCWAAAGAAGEWLQVDFGGIAEVRAVQACFGECNAFDAWRKPDAARRWRVEATTDGTSWRTVVDASAATDANDHVYRAFAEPVRAKALRLVCVSLPADARFVVRDLRAFGSMAKPVPSAPADLAVVRDAADARHAHLKWAAVPGAAGYLVRFGPTLGKMHLSWIVRGTPELDLRCLDAQLDYHWSVAAYNEAGFSR